MAKRSRTKPPNIESLCSWKQVDTAQTLKRLKLSTLFKKADLGEFGEQLFGEQPRTFVHEGDVTLSDSVLLNADGHGVFIITGSLHVKGTFTFDAYDAYTVLVVLGDVTAENLQQTNDTQLFVLGQTDIARVLHLNVSDAGLTVFRGAVSAKDIYVNDNGVANDVPIFARKPKGRRREQDGWSQLVLEKEPSTLHELLLKGEELFAPPTPKNPKLPSKAALEAMTVEDCLALGLTGFEEMQFEARVNSNYWKKGAPGEPLKRLWLMNDTYVTFPATLAPLEMLKLLMFRDVKKLSKMLESLPRGLRELRLVSTPLTEVPEVLQALPQLEVLELRDNKLTALPEWLAQLPHLKTLEVNEPGITKWPKALKRFAATK